MQVNVRNRNVGKTYQDGKKKPPNWEWRFETAAVDGKRKRISKGGYKTKKEALEAGAIALAEYKLEGATTPTSKMSVADWMNYYLDNYCTKNLKETSVNQYRKVVRTHITPEIGHYYIGDITPLKLQELVDGLVEEKLAWNTIKGVVGFLRKSFAYAVHPAMILKSSPAMYLQMPNKRTVEQPTNERRAITKEEWELIIQRFPEGHREHIPLILAYRCGLRRGEVFGLMWEDVDFDNATLTVKRQTQLVDRHWKLLRPKYDSDRTLHLDDATCALLKRRYDFLQSEKERYGEFYHQLKVSDGIVGDTGEDVHMLCVNENGTYITPSVTWHISKIVQGKHRSTPCICEDFDFHSLRHTHATMLYEAGVPLLAIQKRLGHSSVSMTNHYTHVRDGLLEQLNVKVDELYAV